MRVATAGLQGGVAGCLVVLSGPPHGWYLLAVIGLVPLLVAAGRGGAAGALAAGATTGTIVYAVGLPWLLPTVARLQGLPTVAAVPAAAAFVAYHQLPFALLALVAHALLRPRRGRAVTIADTAALAGAWVVVEWALPQVLPFALGSLLGPAPWLRQLADVGGARGLSFLVVLINGLTARALLIGRADALAAAAAAALVAASGGWARERAHACGGMRWSVALVQGNEAAAARGGLEHYAGRTAATGGAADLIVWPEAALAVPLRDDARARRRLAGLLERVGRPILLGAPDRVEGAARERNGAHLLSPSAGMQAYHKRALVPFAEYVPGAWRRWMPGRWRTTGAFEPGSAAAPLRVASDAGSVALAPAICVEAIEPGWFNAAVRAGASLLVALSDDSWFASATAARQHLEMSRLRAVETRRWLVRASNAGISAVVDPRGELVVALPPGRAGTALTSVGLCRAITPYARWGEWVVAAGAALLVAAGGRRLATRCRATVGPGGPTSR